MQDKQITNSPDISEIAALTGKGRILALDIGTSKIGAAVSDELQITVRPLFRLRRKSWKELLQRITSLIEEFDAVALVLGLPYNFDGSENEMTAEVRRLHRNFSLSLQIPVFLQDERLSTVSAQQNLYDSGMELKDILKVIDAEAAAVILSDFLALKEELLHKK